MPQLAPLVLTDRRSTPVDHTFVPQGIPNGTAVLVESDGIPIGDKKLTIKIDRTAERRKVRMVLAMPVTQTDGTDYTVVRTNYANVEFNYDIRSTEQERDDIVALIRDALDKTTALVDGVAVDLEDVY